MLAVISIESRFNPIAESVMGAKGLMQIIPRYHLDKLRAAGGEDAVFDPESNIHGRRAHPAGIRLPHRHLEAGLQHYNGASRDESAQYAQKVMAERERLEQVLRAHAGHRAATLREAEMLMIAVALLALAAAVQPAGARRQRVTGADLPRSAR